MKRLFGLSILCVLLLLTGCSSKKELSEIEKLVSYLKMIGYDCGEAHCKKPQEDRNVYLLDDVYKKSEDSYINLTNGTIKEGINFVDMYLNAGESITIIKWDIDYSFETGLYKVTYEYIEQQGDSLITLASGNKTNSSFSHQGFPKEYIDASPHLTPQNMESHSSEMYNHLINRWDKLFALAGIDKEKLIEEFKQRT